MGQVQNKYHISNDGEVYKVNEDGSFTSMGNIENLQNVSDNNYGGNTNKPQASSLDPKNTKKSTWWKKNYNWLWVTNIVIFICWFISCLSCRWPEYEIGGEDGEIVGHYKADNIGYILVSSAVILFCVCLSRYLSNKNKKIFKFIHFLLLGCAISFALPVHYLCEQEYSFLLICLAIVPFTLWIVSICLSIFRRK